MMLFRPLILLARVELSRPRLVTRTKDFNGRVKRDGVNRIEGKRRVRDSTPVSLSCTPRAGVATRVAMSDARDTSSFFPTDSFTVFPRFY